jgi:hypothetical protein
MNQDQINSLVRTALKIIGALLIKHGLSDYAAILNTPDVCGAVALMIGLYLSHQHHGQAATTAGATADLRGIIEQFAQGPAAPNFPANAPASKTATTPAPEPNLGALPSNSGSAAPAPAVPATPKSTQPS